MDVHPKFIIETDRELGDCLIIAKCTYHRQLSTFEQNVKGGGWWKLNLETMTFTLYGTSEQFGSVSVEDIKYCIETGNVFRRISCDKSIANEFKFIYNTGSEEINLN